MQKWKVENVAFNLSGTHQISTSAFSRSARWFILRLISNITFYSCQDFCCSITWRIR